MSDQYHPAIIGSDTIDLTAGPMSRLGDAFLKGAPAAAISGGLSIYNSFREYGGKEALDTYETIRNYDQSWGDYYQDHKEGVDLVGFVGTSLLPGTLGVKALRFAQAGEAVGAVSRALQLVPSRKMSTLKEALEITARSGGTVTAELAAAKRAQLAWSLADNVMTSAAAELAVVATMHASPTLENMTLWDLSKNVLTGAAFGGAVGGLLDHWAARGVIKQARTQIELARRNFDTVLDTTQKASLGLGKGDEALVMAESIVKLSDDEINLNFAANYDGKKIELQLPTAGAFKKARGEAEKVGFDKLALKFNELAGGDEIAGQAMFKFIRQQVATQRAGGESVERILESVQGYMHNLKSVSSVDEKILAAVAKRDAAALVDTPYMYLDLKTGGLRHDAAATVADLKGFKNAITDAEGLTVAGRKFKQADSMDMNISMSPLDASARYLWAARKGAKLEGKVISIADFPVMHALMKSEQAKQAIHGISDFGIKVKLLNGNTVPLDSIADRLPALLNEAKLELLAKQYSELKPGSKVPSAREISAVFNVSEDWIERAVTSNYAASKELIEEVSDVSRYLEPSYVQVEYNLGRQTVKTAAVSDIGPAFQVSAELSHHYRLRVQKQTWDNAFRSVIDPEDVNDFPDTPMDLAKLTTSEGAGADTWTAANADYGDKAGQFVEYVGKKLATMMNKMRENTIQSIAPYVNEIRSKPEAARELGVLTTALRLDPERYVPMSLGDTNVLADVRILKMMESETNPMDYENALVSVKKQGGRGEYRIQNPEVFTWFEQGVKINSGRVNKMTTLYNAVGLKRNLDDRVVYVPPIDTRRYPYYAFVRAKQKVGNITDHAMIVAKSDSELRDLAAEIPDDYEVIYKSDTENWFKAKSAYDYDLQTNESQVNSMLKRNAKLGSYFPEVTAQNVLEDYVVWHGRQEENLARLAVQVKYRDFFAQMGFLSDMYTRSSTSVFRGMFQKFRSQVEDPFGDYMKTMLNISKQSEYPLLDSLNEFVDKIGYKVYEGFQKAWQSYEVEKNKGKLLEDMKAANDAAEYHGVGTPFTSIGQYIEANSSYPRNVIKEAVIKTNSALATVGLRLDFANSLINIISMPIMVGTELQSIRTLAGRNAEVNGMLNELLTVKVPGREQRIPSTARLIGEAVTDFFKQKDALLPRYRSIGAITDVSKMYHEMLDNLAYMPQANTAGFMARVDAGVEKAAKITGNVFSEELTRFVSARIMDRLTEPLVKAGRMSVQEQNAFILSFVNRTNGNYLYSQRPVIFQGTTGAAVGLFQTYAFNVMQQLARHIQNSDKKAMLTFAGLQSTLYGFNGLPFFDAINTHIIGSASGNRDHADAYNRLPEFNRELGNWMLYGTASAFPLFGEKGPALYTRGDMNPRHVTIIPNPMNPTEIPAVSASIKLVDTVTNFGKKVANGADISDSMLQALEHQGWSRPLAGFAQLLAGQSTTSKGALVSASSDLETTVSTSLIYDRLVDFGGATRVLGAKPMDEALALHSMYRGKAYDAMDRKKIEQLGMAVKTKLYAGESPSAEELYDFMQKYQASGGRIETFSQTLQSWMRDANTSVLNQMSQRLGTHTGRTLQSLMGGNIEDYTYGEDAP